MEILETREFALADSGAAGDLRPLSREEALAVLADPPADLRIAVRTPTDLGEQERVAATVAVAVAQGRIAPHDANGYLALGERDPQFACDTLVAMPPRGAEDRLYGDYAASTGVPQHERPEPVAEDREYFAYALATGVPARVRTVRA
ncbi:MAG: hypothetical protein H0X39_03860 [Actinobacteria bacterium]|nr:hypothetical protein [Actinomycetota bacterium]